ncbi:uncharacterized protein LOC105424044 [Pogonomyrmex barbatus]|uniref:Uncharacterized protein LOC105424044 n=1 Tax=Pogonomyrmex barbatus TaxID=144034 RepID=A0A6I9W1X7_9HYME|nr:uncharacterized protein LOC105424044 [Pogonomyrmex barbatus]
MPGGLRVTGRINISGDESWGREYLIFSPGHETRTGTIGPFVLRIDRPALAIDILEKKDSATSDAHRDGIRKTSVSRKVVRTTRCEVTDKATIRALIVPRVGESGLGRTRKKSEGR